MKILSAMLIIFGIINIVLAFALANASPGLYNVYKSNCQEEASTREIGGFSWCSKGYTIIKDKPVSWYIFALGLSGILLIYSSYKLRK